MERNKRPILGRQTEKYALIFIATWKYYVLSAIMKSYIRARQGTAYGGRLTRMLRIYVEGVSRPGKQSLNEYEDEMRTIFQSRN